MAMGEINKYTYIWPLALSKAATQPSVLARKMYWQYKKNKGACFALLKRIVKKII